MIFHSGKDNTLALVNHIFALETSRKHLCESTMEASILPRDLYIQLKVKLLYGLNRARITLSFRLVTVAPNAIGK